MSRVLSRFRRRSQHAAGIAASGGAGGRGTGWHRASWLRIAVIRHAENFTLVILNCFPPPDDRAPCMMPRKDDRNGGVPLVWGTDLCHQARWIGGSVLSWGLSCSVGTVPVVQRSPLADCCCQGSALAGVRGACAARAERLRWLAGGAAWRVAGLAWAGHDHFTRQLIPVLGFPFMLAAAAGSHLASTRGKQEVARSVPRRLARAGAVAGLAGLVVAGNAGAARAGSGTTDAGIYNLTVIPSSGTEFTPGQADQAGTVSVDTGRAPEQLYQVVSGDSQTQTFTLPAGLAVTQPFTVASWDIAIPIVPSRLVCPSADTQVVCSVDTDPSGNTTIRIAGNYLTTTWMHPYVRYRFPVHTTAQAAGGQDVTASLVTPDGVTQTGPETGTALVPVASAGPVVEVTPFDMQAGPQGGQAWAQVKCAEHRSGAGGDGAGGVLVGGVGAVPVAGHGRGGAGGV